MTYHDEVHKAAHKHVQTFRPRPVGRNLIADDALDAIPPLTLKTEDGRFVKVERVSYCSFDGLLKVTPDPNEDEDSDWIVLDVEGYRIVEDPTQ